VRTLTSKLKEELLSFDADKFIETVKSLIKQGSSPTEAINALTEALKEIGTEFEKGDLFIVHLVAAGDIAKRATTEVLEPLLKAGNVEKKVLGKVVIGTVAGDIHDIGKNIVATMLFSAGFEVIDLGKDVPIQEFVNKVKETNADMVAMSALLTTTLPVQRDVIEALKKAGLRGKVKIIVGGAPATALWAREIGADGYGEDPIEAVRIAKSLLGVSED
jgi:corrinoid protein of di/trimethylamine methyltransferase